MRMRRCLPLAVLAMLMLPMRVLAYDLAIDVTYSTVELVVGGLSLLLLLAAFIAFLRSVGGGEEEERAAS